MTTRARIAFFSLAILWGIPFFLIKVAIDDGLAPMFIAWFRSLLGAAVLLPLAWHSRTLGSIARHWRWLVAYGVIEIAVPFSLIALGEQHLASSTTAIVLASTPLIVALLALRFDHEERITGNRLVGLLLGLAGVATLVGVDIGVSLEELVATFLIGLAAVGYAASPLILKHHLSGIDLRAVMGGSLGIVAVLLAPFAAVSLPHETPSVEALVSLLTLGCACTAAALIAVGVLVSEVGPGRAMVVSYLNPVVALALGVLVLGERPGVGAAAGLALILAGSWLAIEDRRLWGFIHGGARHDLRPAKSPERDARCSQVVPEKAPPSGTRG